MTWFELTVKAPEQNVQHVIDMLEAHGITEVIVEDEADFHAHLEATRMYWDYVDETLASDMVGKSQVVCYLENTPAGVAQRDALQQALPLEITVREIKEEDWANNWKRYYRPIPIGDRLIVLPAWEEESGDGRVALRLDPGLIFGTGSHPTTKRCLELATQNTPPDGDVLDLGMGSGILSIAALLLGAKHVLGCDIDPKAPDVARQNAALNGIDAAASTFLCGNVLSPGPLRERIATQQYDLIFANIVADVLIDLAPLVYPWLQADGCLICAGIITGREDEVVAAMCGAGFTVAEQHRDEDWISLVCRK